MMFSKKGLLGCWWLIGVHHINSWASDPEVYKQLNNFNSRRINKARRNSGEELLNRLGSFTFMDPWMMISKGEVTWKSQMMHYRSLVDSFLAGAMVWMTFFIGYLCHEGKKETNLSAYWLSGAVALVHLLVIAVCLGGNMWCDGTWSKDSWELWHFLGQVRGKRNVHENLGNAPWIMKASHCQTACLFLWQLGRVFVAKLITNWLFAPEESGWSWFMYCSFPQNWGWASKIDGTSQFDLKEMRRID